MLDAGQFALQVEIQRRLVGDILLSLLADPSTTDRRSPRYIPRQVIQLTPNAEVALWWDAPTLSFDDPTDALFTVQVQGGARQPETGRILTVNGSAQARLRLQVMSDADRTPHLGMSFVSLDLTKLTLTYGGAPMDAYTPGSASGAIVADVRRENGPLWRTINESLITPLTRLPLSPAWGILTDWKAQGLRLGDANARALNGDVVAFTLASARTQGLNTAPLAARSYLDDRSDLALTLSADGLTQIAARLLDNGALPRRLRGERGDDLAQVEAIGFAFRDAVATLTAQMNHADASGDFEATVSTDLSFEIDNRGALLITPIGQRINFRTQINAPGTTVRYQAAEQALATAGRMLAMEFGLALPGVFGQPRPTGPLDHPLLPQWATIPSTTLQRELTPTRAIITREALTILCSVPLTGASFMPSPPARQPQVAIRRRPTRALTTPLRASGVALEATISAQSYEPYDYFWTTETSQPLGERTAAIVVPLPGATSPRGVQATPMQAIVALIDGFGQVARESVPLRLTPPGMSGVASRPLAPPTPSMPGGNSSGGPAIGAGGDMAPTPLAVVPSGFADDAEYQSLSPSVYSTAIGYDSEDADNTEAPTILLDSQQREVIVLPHQRRRRSRLTGALALLLILALLFSGVGAFLLLNHPGRGKNPLSGTGIIHDIFGGGPTSTAGGAGSPGPGGTPAPGATTTPHPKATHTPTGTVTPTVTPQPGSTPTPTTQPGTPTPLPSDPNANASPTTTNQTCAAGSGVPAFTVTLDNSGSTTVNWTIVLTQSSMGSSSTLWASVSPSGGSSLASGNQILLTVTPSSQDCPLIAIGNTTNYTFTIVVTNSDGSGNTQQIVVNDSINDTLGARR